jgi:uncharacterized protein YfaS (alpha-2-macroglobulin family)
MIAALLVTALSFTFACDRRVPSAGLSPELAEYIHAYTSGAISKVSPIRIQFTRPLLEEDQLEGRLSPSILRLRPAVKGELRWEDRQTLRFDPAEPLASGSTYQAQINLRSLLPDLPKAAAAFSFEFQTRGQFYQVELDHLRAPNPADLSQQELPGRLYTADYAESEAAAQMLEARQDGKVLEISWQHSANQQEHYFVVRGIARSDKPSTVALSWTGKPLKVDLKGGQNVEAPALGDFKVMDVRLSGGASPYATLYFSDPLMANQSLEGLVSLSPSVPARFAIEGQELRVYPATRPSGELRLTVNPGLRNSVGQRMTQASVWAIEFPDTKPQVRLAGRGVIMPHSEGLLFPFEAIGLTAVEVEIFKIFNNNILQFLQNNTLDNSDLYSLREVGRIIARKKVDLLALQPAALSGEWTRYALDLGKLIREDPEAIYQVRIGFRPEYAVYNCAGQAAARRPTPVDWDSVEEEAPESILNYWYGVDGYYNDYRWEHRDDPCYPAYYNSERFVARNVLASNLGIIAKGGGERGYFVAVTDLRDTRPVSGATVEFYDYQRQLLYSAQTDGKGMLSAQLERAPFMLVARQGGQRGFLRMDNGDALNLSSFDVAGDAVQKGLKGYLYAERGVWRPGDSVYLHFLLDDRHDRLPANYPVVFELSDPRGILQERRSSAFQVGGIYPLHFATAAEAPTGAWTARVKAGGAVFERIIKIETVKPNRLSINLDFGRESQRASDEPLSGRLSVKWLHGAPARGFRTQVEARLQAGGAFPAFSQYRFVDPARTIDFDWRVIFDGATDDGGQARFSGVLLEKGTTPPGQLTAAFRTRAFEPGGDFSFDFFTMPYHPYNTYVGIQLPKNAYEEPSIGLDEEGLIQIQTVGADGKAAPQRRLSLGVYRVDWRWWWDQGYDNIARFNSSNHFNATQPAQSLTTGADGKANYRLRLSDWGRYLLRICDAESGHCAGDFIYVGSPGLSGEGYDRQAAARLNIQAEKEKYQVGETAKISIPSAQKGRALVTLESGAKVLRSFWLEASGQGEQSFSFKVEPEMAPTIYAHVSFIQPHAHTLNDLPIRLYGVIPIAVEDPGSKLTPTLKLPEKLAPEQSFTLEVAEQNGRPMAYTLAVVEEGLLGLTRFNTPNPHEIFYAREALGVRTWDVYDLVLGAFGGRMERLLSIGGDAAIVPGAADQQANRFEPVVRHLGPFFLKKGQKAKHSIRIPNYVGAVRVMLVAAHEGAYGFAEKTLPVEQPLMVAATLPRVLSPGEQVRLPVTVFAMDKKVSTASIKVEESTGLAQWSGARAGSLRFDKPGEATIYFDFKVAEQLGVARFTVSAEGGGVSTRQNIEVQVRNPNPYQTQAQARVLDPGQEWNAEFEALGMAGTNTAVLEVSNFPPLNLGERLRYLLAYPYGCLEQVISSGFPQLYVHRLMELDQGQKEQAAANVRATIERLKQHQTEQGGFAYWPSQGSPNHWASNYGGHFLLEAQALGYSLPAGLLQRWVDFQKKTARMWSNDHAQYGFYDAASHQLSQAYRLYTLALAKEADLAAMNRLRESANLSGEARWRLAAAYALVGRAETSRALVENLSTETRDYRELSYTFGSGMRDQAMILETLTLLGDEERAARLLLELSRQMSASQWLSTQEVAYTLLAASKYLGEGKSSERYAFSYQIDNQPLINAGSTLPVFQVDIPLREPSRHRALLRNTSGQKLFARLITRGQPAAGSEQTTANDLRIAVRYLRADGAALDPGRIAQGTDFVAEVRVSHPGARPTRYRELALNQVFPAGWEILNTRLYNGGETDGGAYDYQDIRDDRVYTFFSLGQGQTTVFRVRLNAAYQGRYFLPAMTCEAMYDHSIYASERGRWVEVVGMETL